VQDPVVFSGLLPVFMEAGIGNALQLKAFCAMVLGSFLGVFADFKLVRF
jgi:hypothetical protein